MLLDFSQQRIPRWHTIHALIYDASKIVSVPWAPTQIGKWGGGRSRENLAILTTDFEKSSIVLQKVGGMPCVHFLLASNTFYSPCIFSVSINTSDSTSASRGEDKHVHVELETKDRNVIILLLLALFLFCFSNWVEIEKRRMEKIINSKTKLGQKVAIKVQPKQNFQICPKSAF